AGGDLGQVLRDQRGQLAGGVGGQGLTAGAGAWRQFQRERAEAANHGVGHEHTVASGYDRHSNRGAPRSPGVPVDRKESARCRPPVVSPFLAASAFPSAATTPPTTTSATWGCRSRRWARWWRSSGCTARPWAKWPWARCSSTAATGTSAARRR